LSPSTTVLPLSAGTVLDPEVASIEVRSTSPVLKLPPSGST
jgi:hypothetical protein